MRMVMCLKANCQLQWETLCYIFFLFFFLCPAITCDDRLHVNVQWQLKRNASPNYFCLSFGSWMENRSICRVRYGGFNTSRKGMKIKSSKSFRGQMRSMVTWLWVTTLQYKQSQHKCLSIRCVISVNASAIDLSIDLVLGRIWPSSWRAATNQQLRSCGVSHPNAAPF